MEDRVKELFTKVKHTAAAAGKAAAEVCKNAGERAGDLVENTKINLQIFDLNHDLDELYRDLGKLVYAAHADPEADTQAVNGLLEQVDAKKAEVDALGEKLKDLRSLVICPNKQCAARCGKDDKFCRRCGTKID